MRVPICRHVVFDIGNVLIKFDPEKPFRRLIPDTARRAYFLSHICNRAWNQEQDRGRPWAEGERLLIEKFPEFDHEIKAYRTHFQEMVSQVITDNVRCMQELIRKEVDVTILTNAAGDTLRETMRLLPFLNEVRGIAISGDIGTLKPELEIYERHAKEYGLIADHTLFIDDKEENIEAARAFGWYGIVYSDATDLAAELSHFDFKQE